VTVIAVICGIAPHLSFTTRVAIVVTSPFTLIILWCFKDVFRDFGLSAGPKNAATRLRRPDTIALPDDSSQPPRIHKKRKRPESLPTWWHPLGGYSKKK